jgi:hypothetical protein
MFMSNTKGGTNARGSAGGAASTGGAVYAGSVGAWCAVQLLLGKSISLPWKLSAVHNIKSLACESSTHVDDLVLQLLPHGTVYIQIKHGLVLGAEFNKALAQLVRQFWSSGFSCKTDRLVIATDMTASSTVRVAVRSLLRSCHDLAKDTSLDVLLTSDAKKAAFDRLKERFEVESLSLKKSARQVEKKFRDFLSCAHVTILETMDGQDENYAIERLHQVLLKPEQARQAWTTLNASCLKVATLRSSVDLAGLWDILRREGIEVSSRRLSLEGLQVQLQDVVKAMTQARIGQLLSSGRIDPERYVTRRVLDGYLLKFIGSPNSLMVLSGGSGKGKTSWCANIAATPQGRPVLLVAAESLHDNDAGLVVSLCRLISEHIGVDEGYSLSSSEISYWLQHTPLLVLIDGLDRAPAFSRHLNQWMDLTLAQMTKTQLKLVLTGRPETIGRLHANLEFSSLVFTPHYGAPLIQLDDFTDDEAGLAAARLGDPSLARYRHPSMMWFSAQIQAEAGFALRPGQIVDRFIEHRKRQVISDHEILSEQLAEFIECVSKALARSEQGLLAFSGLSGMPGFNLAAYEALRRGNFIIEAQGQLRVEPDEVSERLHGRCLDVAQTISDLPCLNAFPLKMGALRSALTDLAVSDADQAVVQLQRLIQSVQEGPMDIARSLACSVFEALPDWTSLEPLAATMGRNCQERNIFLIFEPNESLLKLLTSDRWSEEQRIRLLWELAKGESGYDWREKHWLGHRLQPGFSVTPWRQAMLQVLEESQGNSWTFLIERFGLTHALQDTSESVMGDVARALFYLSAKKRMWSALQALAVNDSEYTRQMLRLLARDFPDQVAVLIQTILESRVFGLSALISLARGMETAEGEPVSAVIQAMRLLIDHEHNATLRDICLHALARGGDQEAARELIESPGLHSANVSVCLAFFKEDFALLAQRIVTRVLLGEVMVEALGGFEVSTAHDNFLDVARFIILQPLLMQVLEQMPQDAAVVARVVESLVYEAACASCAWPGLIELVNKILMSGDSRARSTMVYASTGDDRCGPSQEGQQLRTQIIEMLIEYETDPKLLTLLIGKLFSNRSDYAQTPTWLAKLIGRYPDLPYEKTAATWGFGSNEQKFKRLLGEARAIVNTAAI